MDRLRAMQVLVQVSEQGSMAGAARALDMAPAAVTRLIAELEADLGARLLQRTTRRLAFTEVGERYLERSRLILAEVEEARALVDEAQAGPRGHLRLLAPPALAVHQLTRLLPAFAQAHPEVTVELHTPGPVEQPDETFDLTLLLRRDPPEGGFVARLLACSEVVLCAAPAYLQRRGRPRQPADLLTHDSMLPPRMDTSREVHFARRDGRGAPFTGTPQRPPLLRSSHLDVMLAAALQGLGIAGLPSFVAHEALASGRLERLLPAWRLFSVGLWAAMPTRHHVPARTRAMLEHLLQAFGGREHDPWLNLPQRGVLGPIRKQAARRRHEVSSG